LVAGFVESIVAQVPTRPSSSASRLDKGFIDGKTYVNPSLGLELTPDPSLKLGNPELRGTPGTMPLQVAVAAWGEQKWLSTREGTVFYADALAYYPDDQRSTSAYIQKIILANRNNGFQSVLRNPETRFGAASFARADFFKKGPIYETVLVRACDTLAFVFVFTGSGKDAVNKLIERTNLKLDLLRSGCGRD
jgi:hypothetical protein